MQGLDISRGCVTVPTAKLFGKVLNTGIAQLGSNFADTHLLGGQKDLALFESYFRDIFCRRHIQIGLKQIGQTYLYAPSADFTALFLTAHSLSHFLFESIKLRHVLDWAFFLKAEHDNVDWNNFWKWCDRMKYTRFVMCLNHICVHYLKMDLPAEVYRQGDENVAALSERIMNDIFSGYSLYTQKHSGLMHRVMIISRYLKCLWKFNEVHQRNAFWLMTRRIKNYWVKDVSL